MKRLGLALILLICIPQNLFAGAWTNGKNKLFIEIYSKYYWTTKNFNNDGEKKEIPFGGKYDEYRTEFKMEYGVSDNINLLFSIPYKWARFKNDFDTFKNEDVEDILVGLKCRFLDEDGYKDKGYPTISLLIRQKFPGSYDENKPPAIGAGEEETEARLLIGKKFNTLLHSIGGEIGYRIREKEIADKIPYFAEANLKLTDWIFLRFLLDGVAVTSRSKDEPTERALIKKTFEEYAKEVFLVNFGGFGATTVIPGLSVELGYGYTFSGKNTAEGSEVILNIAYYL